MCVVASAECWRGGSGAGSTVSHIDLAVAGLGKLSYKLGVTAMETLRKVYTTMEEHHTSIMGRCDATQTPARLAAVAFLLPVGT